MSDGSVPSTLLEGEEVIGSFEPHPPAAVCPVPLGGRGGQPCGQPALHSIRDWSRRSNADQRYYVCCDHAPGTRHGAASHKAAS